MVQSLTDLGKILLHYSRKKEFQSQSKQVFKVLPSTFERLAIHQYINAFSNHSPTFIKQLLKSINKRISDLSCNKKEFDKVKSVYETVLKYSGHFSSMSFNNSNAIEIEGLYGLIHHIAKI